MNLAAIEQKILAYPDAWNQHDHQQMSKFYTEDAGFINVFGEFWQGRIEIQSHQESLHQTVFQNSHLSYTSVQIKYLKPDLIVAYLRWKMHGHTTSNGDKLPMRIGIITQVMIEQGGDWLIETAQNTEVVEPFKTASFQETK